MHCTQERSGRVAVVSKVTEKAKWIRKQGGLGLLAEFMKVGIQERLGFRLEQNELYNDWEGGEAMYARCNLMNSMKK